MQLAQPIIGAGCAVAGLALAGWIALGIGPVPATPVVQLTVTATTARPTLVSADTAISPVVPAFANVQGANPFVLGERGARAGLSVPEPPPPLVDLPAPPPSPFVGGP
jgi:hypothetical protein